MNNVEVREYQTTEARPRWPNG